MIINDYLHDNHMSKYQLAKECNLPYGTLNDICTGKTAITKCSGETLLKIANTIGTSVNDLLNDKKSSIFNLDKIRKAITPIAKKHNLHTVYIFGSYARNEATENSDIDILIDRSGSNIHGIFGINALFNELREALGKDIDLVTLQSLLQPSTINNNTEFIQNIMKDRVKIYEN